VAALVGLALLFPVGCVDLGTVDRDTAAQSVADVVFSRTGFRPNDVRCPSGVDAKVGTKFDCRFTGRDGQPTSAHMQITKVGDHVDFDVVLPST
jgi:hypothetical protein